MLKPSVAHEQPLALASQSVNLIVELGLLVLEDGDGDDVPGRSTGSSEGLL